MPGTTRPCWYLSTIRSHSSGCAAEAERDLLRLRVYLHHVHVDLVADPVHVLRGLVAVPRDLAEVREPVRPAQVDEHAKAADAGHASLADLAFLQLREQPVLLL
jgi:hypothetical protein